MQLNEVMNAIEKALDDEREEVSASVWTSIEKRVQEAIRAQADARPVAWYDRATGNVYPLLGEGERYAAGVRQLEPLYTHPEASAPGLSDGDLEQWAEESMRKIFCTPIGEPIPEELAVEKAALLECVQSLLTRASAATVAEPVVLPDAAYCALQYVEGSLAAIANRQEIVAGETIQRIDTITAASKRAKAALSRLQAVAHHFDALEAAQQQAEPGADERAAFEAWCERFPEISSVERLQEAYRAAQSGQRAGVAEKPWDAAVHDVVAERTRQITHECATPIQDDGYTEGELALAASCYAMASSGYAKGQTPPIWPWHVRWWKPSYGRRDLVKAGALILAEIERLDRAAAPTQHQEGGS